MNHRKVVQFNFKEEFYEKKRKERREEKRREEREEKRREEEVVKFTPNIVCFISTSDKMCFVI